MSRGVCDTVANFTPALVRPSLYPRVCVDPLPLLSVCCLPGRGRRPCARQYLDVSLFVLETM